jgi:Pyruvate/2-oxoacid:ferredoxin oxidoreductase delta subunit
MLSDSLTTEKIKLASIHRHRPMTLKVYFNTCVAIIVYCPDCGLQLNKYLQELEYKECLIGVKDSAGIS